MIYLCGRHLHYSLLRSATTFIIYKIPTISEDIYLIPSQQQILDSSKLKGYADDNSKFDENGRQFSERIENSVGIKRMISSNFSFSHCVFKRPLLQTPKNQGLFGKRVKNLDYS